MRTRLQSRACRYKPRLQSPRLRDGFGHQLVRQERLIRPLAHFQKRSLKQRDRRSERKNLHASRRFAERENDKRTQNWQIQLKNAQAELNGMERELSASEAAMSAMGKEKDATAKSSGELGSELIKAAGQQ